MSPVLQSSTSTTVYHSAAAFLDDVEHHLKTQEMTCNTILPLAQKYRRREGGRRNVPSSPTGAPGSTPPAFDNVWFASWSSSPSQHAILDFVLAVTHSPLGKTLPVFIQPAHPTSLDPITLHARLFDLTKTLVGTVSRRRVFAVFAPTPVTCAFTQCWRTLTGAIPIETPFYAAALSYVTRRTITGGDTTVKRLQSKGKRQLPYILQLATLHDLDDVARLCKAFADDAETYSFSVADAYREARQYIDAGQMYGCYTEMADGTWKLVTIVAATRCSGRNATITKVHTDPDFQGCSYAEVLVRFVCQTLLHDPRHSYDVVSLFVAFDNKPANITYDRVGFVGLMGKPKPDGVDDYLEIGFEDVDMGFW